MSRFSSPAVALAYFILVGMGVVALLVAAGRVGEAIVRELVVLPLLVGLALAGLWEFQRRRGGGDDGAPAEPGGADTDA